MPDLGDIILDTSCIYQSVCIIYILTATLYNTLMNMRMRKMRLEEVRKTAQDHLIHVKSRIQNISNASNVDIVVVVEDTHAHQCIWALAVMGFKFFLTEPSLWRIELNSLIKKIRDKGSQGAGKYKIYVYWELKLKVDRFRWTCQQDIWLYNSYSSYEVKCCFCLFKRILAVFVFISHY